MAPAPAPEMAALMATLSINDKYPAKFRVKDVAEVEKIPTSIDDLRAIQMKSPICELFVAFLYRRPHLYGRPVSSDALHRLPENVEVLRKAFNVRSLHFVPDEPLMRAINLPRKCNLHKIFNRMQFRKTFGVEIRCIFRKYGEWYIKVATKEDALRLWRLMIFVADCYLSQVQ
jgi:hypothetical protein